MAEDARSERQLMRQRGTGDRELALANFDFNFGADSREDRQLMRQRGAGNRQVEAVDFGFHFATPSTIRSRRSRIGSGSPGTATRQHGSTRKTPEPVSGLQPPMSAQSARSRGSRSVHGGSPSAQPPRKRRRLSEISNMSRASSVPLPFSSVLKELPNVSDLADLAEHPAQQRENAPSSPLFFSAVIPDVSSTPGLEDESSILSNTSKTSTKRKKRRSIGQQSRRSKKRRTNSIQPLPTPPETQEGSVQSTDAVRESTGQRLAVTHQNRQSRRWSVESHEPDSALSTTLSRPLSKEAPPESPIQLDDQSIESQASNQQNDYLAEQAPSVSNMPIESIEEADHDINRLGHAEELPFELTNGDGTIEQNELSKGPIIPELSDEGEYSFDYEHAEEQPHIGSVQRRPITLNIPHINNIEEADEEADEDYVPEQNLSARPGKRKAPHQKQPNSRRSRSRSTGPSSHRQRKKPGVPILTYRITNVGSLPTIDEVAHEDDDESDANEFTRAPPAFTSRKSANAVDVLRQACHEQIDLRIEQLQDSDLSRAELNNCILDLQSFKTALHTHLFQVSQSLDHRLNLEARLRRSRKEKAILQARWLEIRRRRDVLDLQKDEIRRKTWESRILDEKRNQASQAAFALENAVERQEEEEEEEDTDTGSGLELRLRMLAKDVSSQAGGGGGILQNLKRFNTLLESLASTTP